MATSRNWNDNEEDVLLTILEEMVVDGVRCETGNFKAGTFKHPNASYKPNKPFPLYPRLCTVFGIDQATGSMVESAADVMENMAVENEDCDETFEMPPTSHTPSPFVGWDKAVTEMKNLGESFTLREVKAKLPSQLKAMGIPYDQVLKFSMKLVKDTDMLSFWCTLDDFDKPDFIKMFMDGS
ncbi:hypothetical protein C1H46_005377 [Malus baccata]|uniref:Uncharacterized protein n=1 Tax=Malus baccata TaxID=106549 RepID=A0A540ND73_MALBA|nr:hypothetical protein C1H46_005377 [Malus baccata]